MRNRIALGTLLVLCALALVTPASAFTVNGVDYALLARRGILMEGSLDCIPLPANTLGCSIINGNVGVSNPFNPADINDGRLQVGNNNIINGKAIANRILFGTGAQITECQFNTSTGSPDLVCGNVPPAAPAPVLPIFPGWTPNNGPAGNVPVNNCVNLPATPFVTVAAGVTQALVPGCYKDVRVNAGATLNLSAGDYTFRSLRLIAGSTLNGAGSSTTVVNVQGLTITEAGVKINSLTLETPGSPGFSVTEFISIGNNSTLNDVILYAPSSAIHLHTGMNATNFEAVANFITVQPTIITPILNDCGCFTTVTDGVNSVTISGGQNLLDVQQFFVSTTCNVTPCTAPSCFPVPASGVTNTSATLNTSGAVAGTYKVVGQWSSGSFCNDTTITVP